jgi:hypothetical protein
MGVKFANSAYATLASSINSSATSITLTTGQGARFPSLSGGDYFYATLIDTSNNLEIVKCTARSTDVLTVVRGQEGTTARSYSTSDRIELRITAQGLVDASPVQSVAGRTGAVTLASSDVSGLAASATTDTTNASNISSGTLAVARGGSRLVKVHYFTYSTRTSTGNGVGAVFNFGGTFTPVDAVNNTFTVQAYIPGNHAGQNVNGSGIRFSGSSTYDFRELGMLYNGPGSHQTFNSFNFVIGANAIAQTSYTLQMYRYTTDSNMNIYCISSADDARLSQTVATCIITEYRNP